MGMPPTVNEMWRSAVSRNLYRPRPIIYLSPKYKKYREAEAAIIKEKQLFGFKKSSRLIVYVDYYFKNNRRQDVDNRNKALLDTLTKAGIWHDDCQVFRIVATKYIDPTIDEPYAEVLIDIFKYNR